MCIVLRGRQHALSCGTWHQEDKGLSMASSACKVPLRAIVMSYSNHHPCSPSLNCSISYPLQVSLLQYFSVLRQEGGSGVGLNIVFPCEHIRSPTHTPPLPPFGRLSLLTSSFLHLLCPIAMACGPL